MSTKKSTKDASSELVQALVTAIETTKPKQKTTAADRKPKTPWSNKDGSPKLKLKRKMYQHSLLIDPDMITDTQIELLNKLKPGRYLDGWVSVTRRRDKGVDISYPVKTASHRLKLVSTFGIRDFTELLRRCIEEGENPSKFADADED